MSLTLKQNLPSGLLGIYRTVARFTFLLFVVLVVASCVETASSIKETEDGYHIAKHTRLTIVLQESLSSNTHQRGDTFTATLKQALKIGDSIVLNENTDVNGLVKSSKRYKKLGDKASLVLMFDQIAIPNGNTIPLVASLDTSSGLPPIKVNGKALKETKTVLDTAIAGALMEDPSKAYGVQEGGVLLGAMIGAGAVLLANAKEVSLPKGAEISIVLDEALVIPKKL